MNLEKVIKAEKEAKRFLVITKKVEQEISKDEYLFYGNKLTGALRRSSMDLTRELAELRKPG